MRGVWTAIISPFMADGSLDLVSFKKILADQVSAGVTGVIPCGTTGESPSLQVEEKKLLIQTCIHELKGTDIKIAAGTGSNNTEDTIEMSKWASSAGADAVLVVTPYYNKPSQAGLEAHFLAVASAVKCEVILYNVPHRTGVSLTAETISNLAKHPLIRTLKEATGNMGFTSEILHRLSLDHRSMDILSGDDCTHLPLLSIGAVGVVSVVTNLFPRAMVGLQKAFDAGQTEKARTIHQKYYPLLKDLFIESNPVPLKAAMAEIGWCNANVRAPLAPLTADHLKTVKQSLARCEITGPA